MIFFRLFLFLGVFTNNAGGPLSHWCMLSCWIMLPDWKGYLLLAYFESSVQDIESSLMMNRNKRNKPLDLVPPMHCSVRKDEICSSDTYIDDYLRYRYMLSAFSSLISMKVFWTLLSFPITPGRFFSSEMISLVSPWCTKGKMFGFFGLLDRWKIRLRQHKRTLSSIEPIKIHLTF